MDTVLQTRDLTKQFGKKIAVDHVNMTIEKGDVYGFIGKNGAGKTTLMRMVLTLASPTSGTVELFGGKPFSEVGGKIGSLIETPAFYKNCTVYENLKRFSVLYGADESEILPILELVGLSDAAKKKAGKISLGMKQRLGIAIALLGEPEFMILDEPVNGLDPEGIMDIRNLILRLNREKGITFLISSHLLDELSKVVTRYGIINNGKLVEEVSAEELSLRCKHKLIIAVNDPTAAAALLRQSIPEEDMTVTDKTIQLTSHLDEGAQINQMLSQNGLLVSGIELKSDGMEQYFVERIGDLK